MSVNRRWRERAGTLFQTEKQSAMGSRGVVAANNPLGALAGMEMLVMGGNAFDAAIATLFALEVVEPMMVGLFGAGWTNLRMADGKVVTIDNYSCAPAAATPTMYAPISDSWPNYMETEGEANRLGCLSVGVPGTLKAWSEIVAQWGLFDLETVMQPAIRHAERGYPASGYLCELIADNREKIARFPTTAALLLPNGEPLKRGDRVLQPELAESLRVIAKGGPDVLYGGALGQTIVDYVQREGGILSLADLEEYQTVRREPLVAPYRDYEVVMPPPPCSGGVHIPQILRILEGYDVADMGYGSADLIHLLAETLKIAFADRFAHMGDPEVSEVPVEWMMSEEYAAQRRSGIDMMRATQAKAGTPPYVESANTTHVTIADSEGNIACMTQTINEAFGSKVTVPGTGIRLNNTMAMFDPHPGESNSVASGKRMVSSMSPTIVLKDGKQFMALGTPGGVRIFPSIAQAIVNVIDHGMTLQEAVEAPRIWTQGQELEIEDAIPDNVRAALIERGHTLLPVKTVAGGMNGIQFDQETGTMTGAACWRADGSPIALGGGPGTRWYSLQSDSSVTQ